MAEFKKADAHYQLKEYEEAIFAYEEFENLHPRNEVIPYVIYQIGRSYFDQIDTLDRDQETAKKAIETFVRLKNQFPKDAYSKKAQAHIKKCQKSLAQHDLYVGIFYFRGKHYSAAINRFKLILNNYPDVGVHQEAIRYIAKSEALMAEK
jgi:outer membrane protein assembly factor BamD